MKIKNLIRTKLYRKEIPQIIRSVRADNLTFIGDILLKDIYDQVVKLEKDNANGIIIETGCAMGGSAIVIASAKKKSRPLYVYDVFGMIPPPSVQDEKDIHDRYEVIKSGKAKGIDGEKYYGYEDNLVGKVTDSFKKHGILLEENNVHLVKGLFEDTLKVKDKVCLAHIDADWYESVMTCLKQIEPNLVTKGVLIIDDYYRWSGCKKAVVEYFKDKRNNYKFIHKSRLHIIRK
ncbi:MAG: TylF/MycF/NovP-related O-methyltransferase [Planctomycetota bacterium]|jgi:asparagine synthase (glutamine-hydrolysing)